MELRRGLTQALKIIVSISLIAFLIYKISPARLVPHLRNISPGYLAAAVAVFSLSNLLGSFQWHMLLKASEIRLPFRKTLNLYFVGLFFNNFLPANVGGDAVKIYDVVRTGSEPHQVFAVTLFDRIMGIVALCILALAASVAVLIGGGLDNLGIYMTVFAGVIVPVILLASSKRLSGLVRRIFGGIHLWKLGERFTTVFQHLGELRGRGGTLAGVALVALVVQFLRVATHVLVGLSLGLTLGAGDIVHFYVFIPLLGLIMVLPISINGWGVREGTGILFFTQIGIDMEQAFLLEFITAVVMILVSLVGGVIFLRRHIRKRN